MSRTKQASLITRLFTTNFEMVPLQKQKPFRFGKNICSKNVRLYLKEFFVLLMPKKVNRRNGEHQYSSTVN